MSSSFVWLRPRRLWTKSIAVGMPARETSAASWAGRSGAVRRSRRLLHRLVGEVDELEQDRLDLPDPLPLDLEPLLLREALARLARQAVQLCELVHVEMAHVEQLLRRLDDRGDDTGLGDDAARHLPVADLRGDLHQLERELGGAGERIAALIHRRRPA